MLSCGLKALGKKVDLDGNEVYVGQTPVKALGVTDRAFPDTAVYGGTL